MPEKPYFASKIDDITNNSKIKINEVKRIVFYANHNIILTDICSK
jgi:hypothetical protein